MGVFLSDISNLRHNIADCRSCETGLNRANSQSGFTKCVLHKVGRKWLSEEEKVTRYQVSS